jgi:hypothetical protein
VRVSSAKRKNLLARYRTIKIGKHPARLVICAAADVASAGFWFFTVKSFSSQFANVYATSIRIPMRQVKHALPSRIENLPSSVDDRHGCPTKQELIVSIFFIDSGSPVSARRVVAPILDEPDGVRWSICCVVKTEVDQLGLGFLLSATR